MVNPTHRANAQTLNRRTLERDFQRLAEIVRPGLAILDIGCGTGSITAGLAKAVGGSGRVLGIDRDPSHIAAARAAYGSAHDANLSFECADAAKAPYREEFDIAASARMLQWVSDPALILRTMARAVKPGGMVIALDYIHTQNRWQPHPPPAFDRFYQAFLAWRAGLGFDNEMGANFPKLFGEAGLTEIESQSADEPLQRGTSDFAARSTLWLEALDATGADIVERGYLTAQELKAAREDYAAYLDATLQKQVLVLRAVSGRKPQT